ncbi:DUF4931 domain-containing protein [Staphylococcus sp. EZ-P03]|uniref:DUF4931 domain-containing protein n=1 Tax=Staphylococcus sp. EZ-P03 TaxID=2282739 RepID=UPI000DF73B2D
MNDDFLIFNYKIARLKPNDKGDCPFCEPLKLDGILNKTNDFIWIKNKFNTIENSYQTLIIESKDHNGDISNYPYNYNRKLFDYIIDRYNELSRGMFESVIVFKNFGQLSGGSLRHPHTQIIGFNNIDALKKLINKTLMV